ncbi:MAG: replication C family protein, partial [Rhodoferax sp.]
MKPTKPMPGRRIVHFHPPVGLSTLFRPLPKVKKGMRCTLDISYQPSKDGPALRFSAREALGIPEQTLLLVLIELAQEQFAAHAKDVVLNAQTENDFGKRLWSNLNLKNVDATGETVCVLTTWYELSLRCNSKIGGSGHNQHKAELRRLCEVIVWECHQD